MTFDELDKRMRGYETAHDLCVLPGLWIVARLDGRSFTRLTKETCGFEAPFDERFRDLMAGTVRHLMGVGFRVVYGYTESDELSLVFDSADDLFGRKERKIVSILAGEASGFFSVALGRPACFDGRVSQLPTRRLVLDYLRWRAEDAHRNSLGAHCYWALRKEGIPAEETTRSLVGLSVGGKNELLFRRGTNFNDLPAWQKRGIGVYWEEYERPAVNGKTGEAVVAARRRLKTDLELPVGEAYAAFLDRLLPA
jgi:tRNA(His) 5'-end guanylyltransferase